MALSSWLRNWKRGTPAARRAARKQRFVPRFDLLEDRTVPSGYKQINLTGYQPGTGHFTDSNLNGWGMVSMPNGSFVVANTFTTGLATFYDRSGHVLPQTITVPVEAAESGVLAAVTGQPISTIYGHPTGVVYNSTNDFLISENGKTAPATLIFDTLDGIICGWNPAVDPTRAIVMRDALADSGAPAVYTSLEIAHSGGQNVLYATDFLNNKLEIISPQEGPDGKLTGITAIDVSGHGVATDPTSSVWSVAAVNDKLIVTYGDLLGPLFGGLVGGGAVDVFDTNGHFETQIDANGPTSNVAANATGRLENPWGITLAPSNFGAYSNDLLVGNVWGVGTINVYKPDSTGNYTYLGQLSQPNGTPIAIKGLWDLEFGDGTPQSGKTNQLFFDAGPNRPGDSTGGLFGVIRAAGDQGDNGGDDGRWRVMAALGDGSGTALGGVLAQLAISTSPAPGASSAANSSPPVPLVLTPVGQPVHEVAAHRLLDQVFADLEGDLSVAFAPTADPLWTW